MVIDIALADARYDRSPDARGPPFGSIASCASRGKFPESIKFGHGGARLGAGRPRKVLIPTGPPDIDRWYVARTHHGQTDLADEQIREAGFEVVNAKLCRPATRSRRTVSGSYIRATEERFDPLFVRYIIVRLNLSDPTWRDVLSCEGVERVISGGHVRNAGIGIPISVPDEAIRQLRKILSPAGVWFPPGYRAPFDQFEPGTRLRILDGPFADHVGVCEMSADARVMVLMNLLGGSVPVTVAQSAVEIA